MNTYNLKKMCAVSVASIMCVSALAFSGCGDKKAEVSQTPDETTHATTAVSTADEPTAQWDEKAKDLAGRFIKNFAKFTGNEAGKKLVAAGPKL